MQFDKMKEKLNLDEADKEYFDFANNIYQDHSKSGITSFITTSGITSFITTKYLTMEFDRIMSRLIKSNEQLALSNESHAKAMKWLTGGLVIVGIAQLIGFIMLSK